MEPPSDTSAHNEEVIEELLQNFSPDEQVILPSSDLYSATLDTYWSAQQASTRPIAFFRPHDSHDVAKAIAIFRKTSCPFAIKSGGHTPFAGHSNIPNGVVLDLCMLNCVSVSDDRKTVSLEPGCVWLDVYRYLEPLKLTVIGGRVASVGVGGLILGGGISFFSNAYGWACDNVVNFQVVLSSGDIVDANENSHPDLFWALRGNGTGTKLLGVVTRFDVRAYEHGGIMWGGDRYHPITHTDSLIRNLVEFGTKGVVTDPKTCLILGFAWTKSHGYFASVSLEHMDPQDTGWKPAVFDGFLDVPEAVMDTCGDKPPSRITMELEDMSSKKDNKKARQSFWTLTTYLDEEVTKAIVEIFLDEVDKLHDVEGILPGIGLQVITIPMMQCMRRSGGNSLGLGNETKPLLLLNPSVRWSESKDDEAVLTAFARMVDRAKAAATARGLHHRFLYVNYASQFQDIFNSYTEDARARLSRVAEKCDPEGCFQRLGSKGFQSGPMAKST